MTVLVGLRCKDGVVVGSDSSSTFMGGQQRTIEQKGKKVFVIGNDVIVAGTGQVGLGQRFTAVAETYRSKTNFPGTDALHIVRTICKTTIEDFAFTHAPKGHFGALMAFPSSKGLELCEFSGPDFQPELKTANMWYVSMGCGQPITDPFLGLMRRVFWHDEPPLIKQGLFAVAWALQHTIELNPGGIDGPMQIAILSRNGREPAKARLIEDEELNEHLDSVTGVEQYLSKYPLEIAKGATSAAPIPQPPQQEAAGHAGA